MIKTKLQYIKLIWLIIISLFSFSCIKEIPNVADALTANEMISVPGGTFIMGSDADYANIYERPAHSVTISSFKISKTEVTQYEWKKIMGYNPSHFVGDNLPVENITFYDAITFCNKKSIAEGKTPCFSVNGNTNPPSWHNVKITMSKTGGYRLPSEAEWEYAARSAGKTNLYAGTDDLTKLSDFAWQGYVWDGYNYDLGGTTHGVATKKPNSLGLYDMSGNVWEWCFDCLYVYPATALVDPCNNDIGDHISRGGAYNTNAYTGRVTFRSLREYNEITGMRVVQD